MKNKDKRTELQVSQDDAKLALEAVNESISLLGAHSLYISDSIKRVQGLFDNIRGKSEEEEKSLSEVKQLSDEWEKQVDCIKTQYIATLQKDGVAGTVGTSVGVSVAALGPSAAMGVATTFGVASTGTAISSLSGAAATNAALAWLGGGALASGGGGMVAGQALLALAGPVGWAIAGVSAIVSGVFVWKTIRDNRRLETVLRLISERDKKKYQLAKTDIDARIVDMLKRTQQLNNGAMTINTFGDDYSKMNDEQKYALGSCLNVLRISADLLTRPIPGLSPQYTETDLAIYERNHQIALPVFSEHRDLLIALCNLLYGENIPLTKVELKMLAKSFRKNEEFLETAEIDKSVITDDLFLTVNSMLKYKYSLLK